MASKSRTSPPGWQARLRWWWEEADLFDWPPLLLLRGLRNVWRRRFPRFRVTGPGYGAIVLIVVLAGAAFNTGVNLLYVMLSGLSSVWALTLLLYRPNLSRLEVRRAAPAEVHAGDEFEIRYEIRSGRRMGSYGIAVEERLEPADGARTGRPGDSTFGAYAIAIPPRGEASCSVKLALPRRGLHQFAGSRLASAFPFGLLERRLPLHLPGRVLAFPALVPVDHLLRRSSPEPGEVESPERGQGAGLHSIRDHVPGDPARSIHWKLSAKGTGLKTREYEREDARRARIVFDPTLETGAGGRPLDEELERFERLASVAGSLARKLIDRGYEVSIWSPAGEVASGTGANQTRAILRALALVDARRFARGAERRPPAPASSGGFDVRVAEEPDAPAPARSATAPANENDRGNESEGAKGRDQSFSSGL